MDNIVPTCADIKAIYLDDDHYGCWYADLYVTKFLVEKVRESLFLSDKNKTLCLDLSPEFYANYDPEKNTVAVFSRFCFKNNGKRFLHTDHLSLSANESDFIITGIESVCRQLYSGKNCLTVLNDVRKSRGLSLLGYSLDASIRMAQAGKVSGLEERCAPVYLER